MFGTIFGTRFIISSLDRFFFTDLFVYFYMGGIKKLGMVEGDTSHFNIFSITFYRLYWILMCSVSLYNMIILRNKDNSVLKRYS